MLVNCEMCQVKFEKKNYEIKRSPKHFCSHTCVGEFRNRNIHSHCSFCGNEVKRRPSQAKKSNLLFCNKSCAASHNNKLQRKSRRSKCEELLFRRIIKDFPNLVVIPNDKTMLNGFEVDIAIPDLRLAIEWNGIVHFKPIYGDNKLDKIQIRDKEKRNLANELNINLIVIPDLISTEKYVNEAYKSIKLIIENL